MATDAEVTAAGFKLPVGGDYMNEGDDAISDNARAAVEYARKFKTDFTGSPLSASDNLDTLPNGFRVHTVWSGAVAEALGLPTITLGTVLSSRFGSGAGTQLWLPRVTAGAQQWSRSELSGGWGEWTRIDAGSIENVSMLRSAAPGSLKTAPLALTVGYGGAQTTGTGTTVVIQHMPAAARRVALHLENRSVRYAMADSPPVTISGARVGVHTSNGNASSWTYFPGTGATPLTTGWIEVPEAWRGKDIAVQYTWSSSGAVQRNIGTGWTNGTTDNTPPLFAWLEVEVPASTPVIAAFGDSLSSGVSSSRPVVDSYVDQYARRIGAVPAHWSHSGDKASGWASPAERKWFMYGEAIAAPDVMIYFMGSNDLSEASITAADMRARITDNVAAIRSRITPVVVGATILPRTTEPAGSTFETVRRQVNTWMPASGMFRTVLPFAAAVSSDDETLDPAIDADGVHLTTAGYKRLADAITQPLVEVPAGPYDSGVRNIASLIPAGWSTGAAATVTRIGSQVTVAASALGRTTASTSNEIVLTLPVGLRPTDNLWSTTFRGYRCGVSTAGNITIQLPGASVDYLYFTFVTRDPAPANPPGSPA